MVANPAFPFLGAGSGRKTRGSPGRRELNFLAKGCTSDAGYKSSFEAEKSYFISNSI